ncbi:cupredoxin domain-containing protein [Salinisphaera orenii]|uniref:cupredoxin domain-containing protein n=1 Tax=Salinisphaera orenii TaxID=856731 RepID=UPI000DBE026C
MTQRIPRGITTLGACCLLIASSGAMAEMSSVSVTLKKDGFQPQQISIPADKKVKLKIENASSRPAEFESYDLNREKILAPGTTATLYVGPLSKDTYEFFNDFNKSVKGTIKVK